MTYNSTKGTKPLNVLSMQKVDLFAESIRSPATRKQYMTTLKTFMRDTEIEDLRLIEPKVLQTKLIEYVVWLKNNGRSYSRQNSFICAVKSYCDAYDLDGVNFEKVWKYTSESLTPHNDVPYSREAIVKMLYKASARTRAIILLMASSGVRVGALPELKRRDLQDMSGFGGFKIVVYANSRKDRYVTFCTHEARRAIEVMFEERRHKQSWVCEGHKRIKPIEPEIITDNSPVFRLERSEIVPISTYSAIHAVNNAAFSVGIRPHIDKSQRHKTPATHNFRKIANTAFVKAGVKPVIVEKLLGHKTGLQDNYLRFTDEDLLSEYVKAVDLLTIGDEDTLRRENARLKVEQADLAMLKTTVAQQADKIDFMGKVLEGYAKRSSLPMDDERLKWLTKQRESEAE